MLSVSLIPFRRPSVDAAGRGPWRRRRTRLASCGQGSRFDLYNWLFCSLLIGLQLRACAARLNRRFSTTEIGRNSRTRLENVFSEFAPEEYDFQFLKTRVQVRLLRKDYVSRSEAKRLLHNLDKFAEIELDLRDVKNLGQGFADEVFRVFQTAHPDIVIRFINASDAVAAMIRHVGGSR